MKTSTLQIDLRVTLLYALFGGIWIITTDRLLALFITDVSLLTTLQTYKGWVYVTLSALLIYALLRRELTLRKISEERYHLLFETSIDALLLTAPDGSIHAANPAACHMFGWTEAEIKQLGRSGVIDTMDARLSAALEERANKGYFRGELTFVRKDGSKFPGEISTAIFTDKQGNEQTSMVIRDITERVQAEETLRVALAKYKMLFESFPLGITVSDEAGNVLETNLIAEELLGISTAEHAQRQIDGAEWCFIRTDGTPMPAEEYASVRALKEGRKVENVEMGVLKPDDSVTWINVTAAPLPLEGYGVAITYGDITERKRVEEALRVSQERFHWMFDNMSSGVAVYEAARDGEDFIFKDFNRAAEKIEQTARQDLIGKSVTEVFPGVVEFGLLDVFQRVWQTGVPERHPVSLYKDKRIVGWKENYVYKLPSGEIVAIYDDVTERKKSEAALIESETKYRSLVETASAGIANVDTSGNFTFVNKTLCKMVGYTQEEILGTPFSSYLHPEDIGRILELFQYGYQHPEESLQLEYRIMHKNGRIVHCYSTPTNIMQAGKIIGFSAIVLDITERKQAEDELRHRMDEISALYQTTLDIINVQDLPKLLNTIVTRAVDLLGGTSGGLYLCDPEQKQVRCVVSYKTPDDYTGTVLAYGEGAAGTVAATGESLIIDDYRAWEGRAKAFEGDHPFSAVISVPMFWHGQVIGVIHVLHDTQKHKFTEEDIRLLTAFANQAAVAVENARLFEETQRRLERLSILRRIDQVITSSLDLHVTLNIMVGQILQHLEVDAAAVLLHKPELQSLEFVAGQGFRTRALQSTSLRLGSGFAGQAALERRVVRVSDLEQLQSGFLASPEFRNEEFVAYVGVPLIAKGNIIGVLEIYNRQQLDPDEEWISFLETLAGQAAIAIDNINLFNNLERSNLELIRAYDATIEGWARALELRDMETEGHSRRVVELTLDLARKMEVPGDQLAHIRQGALLHDIGKMGVPDSILQKSGRLTEEEWEIIHQHPVYANKWLAPIEYLRSALDIPYCHHEKWDGTGYPRGLKGEQIPLAARIFAVVDVWDALRSDRPYRSKWSKEKTRAFILEQSGRHFDPKVIETFLTMIENE